MNLFQNKRGASVDNIFAMVMIFVMAVFFLVVLVMWNNISPLDKIWNHNPTTREIKDDAQSAMDLADFMLVMLWVGLHLGILVLAFLLRTHPALLIIAIILSGIMALIAAPLSNAWTEITESESDLTTAANDLPVIDFIMDNLPMFEIVWSGITMIVMFGLARSQGFI